MVGTKDKRRQMTSQYTAPVAGARSCNAFGRTRYAGNESPQAVDATNVTAGNLTACRFFDAQGPSLLHLVVPEAVDILNSGQVLNSWSTEYGNVELPFAKSTPWYNPTNGRFTAQEARSYTVQCTVHVSSNMAVGYRRLALVWLPQGSATPVTIGVCELPPASDTAVPIRLDVSISPVLAAGDSIWFVVETPPSVGTVQILPFPYSWFSIST
jgi:hypothetical protein